ncbi:MAG: dTDP-4-dehydrorhamnose reductase [Muribaculaceae bacterium]|nr:dTDP-4-dehydrorhamnose reductase [Muribaculaceae bacterium]MDE6642657.1 dTDP-4-dehydrorhamnose reductase [Muribaculaceae bacterium]
MRILVTGGNGQLGTCLKIAAECSTNEYIFTDAEDIDITDPEAVALGVGSNNIDVIVNCAAYTNVEKAEEQPEIAEKINAEAVSYLAKAAKDNNCTLIHISTDYVFGGNQGNTPRSESEPTNPTGVYGVTKLHGEQRIAESGCKAIIIRTAWLYSEFGKNFVKTMLNLTETKPELKVVIDQAGTPTYARDLANSIVNIIDNRKFEGNEGIYHYSNEGVCSWYDFTKEIAELSGHTQCNIEPCKSSEFPSPVVRPAYSVLDKTKFKTTFHIQIPYWKDSLKTCIKNLKEQ